MKKILVLFLLAPFLLIQSKDDLTCTDKSQTLIIKIVDGNINITCEKVK